MLFVCVCVYARVRASPLVARRYSLEPETTPARSLANFVAARPRQVAAAAGRRAEPICRRLLSSRSHHLHLYLALAPSRDAQTRWAATLWRPLGARSSPSHSCRPRRSYTWLLSALYDWSLAGRRRERRCWCAGLLCWPDPWRVCAFV